MGKNVPKRAVCDWSTLNEIAAQGYSDGLECLASVDALERSNAASVVAGVNKADLALTFRLVVNGMLFRLQIFIVRAFAEVKHEDDRHLRAAINFLKEPGRLREVQSAVHRERLEKAIWMFDRALADDRLTRLKRMRDKQMAHFARYERAGGPTYVDLYEFAALTASIWEHLGCGTQQIMIDMEDQMKAYRRNAEAFWSHFNVGE
ncbi:hypothetical protein LJR245_004951 [Rhizobium leguminosarum]|uniref:HEPN AbiU2-like domain-containing protein n=2 Tax=Rhizobium TaxID=379 RepID=A0A179BS75_RHILE|nr:hypothetical protein [Rhizobium leguminosarum]OAP94518.1 hypothetical protein A4U53_20950 [Rhizobium leguminosarum]